MGAGDGKPLFGANETVTFIDAVGHRLRSRVIRVEVVEGPATGTTANLPGPSARIGSARDCDLVIADPTVSRHHVTLAVDEHGVRVTDARSRNGTWVDGLRVFDAIARGDSSIKIGASTLRLLLTDDMIDVPLSPNERFGGLLGKSHAMRRVFSLLERIAATDATLLVEAETGTGKDLVAEGVHEASSRGNGPFIVFDCSAVSANLIESELFGHMKGAFTGANADRPGALEAADGGTLFLDEIGELPIDLQPKLLRALENREVRRVGANQRRQVDVRVIAATNRDLSAEIERGRFREDLYYRLAVVHVTLPPLRERPDDIPMLVRHFAKDREVPPAVIAGFVGQAWPGNVRELRNAVERMLSLGFPQQADAEPRLPAPPAPPAVDLSVPLKDARDALLEEFERAYLRAALEKTGGNATKAAAIAGVSRKFVQRALDRYALRDD
ncbi:MAG: sigma 54-interacting transcriptional regulator [Myxococcota bacterium]|nr:sigma 54-interacting transcriptional regulator [Myxococcota bacterium]